MILGDGLLLLFGVCLFFECGGGLWSTKIRWYNVQLYFPTELSMASCPAFLPSFLCLRQFRTKPSLNTTKTTRWQCSVSLGRYQL